MANSSPVSVRAVESSDAAAWLAMRCELWPEGGAEEHEREIAAFFAGEFPRAPWSVWLAETDAGEIVGFAEFSIRPYAEGCESFRVAYLEGWFVESAARGSGVGRALVDAGASWGRAQGCSEMASDCDPQNAISEAAHLAIGFEDAGLVRCFRRTL